MRFSYIVALTRLEPRDPSKVANPKVRPSDLSVRAYKRGLTCIMYGFPSRAIC